MSEEAHRSPNYMAIFWWLFSLTVVEVSYSVFTHPPKVALMTVLVGLAIIKATLVALFFMHLKGENRLVWGFALVPIFFLALIILGTLVDTRLR